MASSSTATKGRPFRYTRGKISVELTLLIILGGWIFILTRWLVRRVKPVAYHPIALAGITLFTITYTINTWITAALALATTTIWPLTHPNSYLRHVDTRAKSFKAGFYYRYRPRRKLSACGLINDQDPIPTVSSVRKQGCITTIRVKMSHGDSLDYWRKEDRSSRIAQTYNALDCKINPYRRQQLNPFKKTLITKPRWVVLEFLTRDPFNTGLGVEYLNYHHQPNTFTPVTATHRNGHPEHDNLAAHKLAVAMTQWGKSNRIRALVYAHKDNIRNGLLELWGIDGKGGIEQSFMQHVFARVAYGDTHLNPNLYNPAEFDHLLKEAVLVLKRRQRRMRGKATHHTPTRQDPWLRIIIDELLVLTSKNIDSNMRNSIAASIMLIQQQGVACGVTLDASTQLAQKEKIEFRDGFTEFEVGKVEKGAVDMIFGTGWWERGARADEIAEDLKGVFYKKTDTTMAPTQIRYPKIDVADMTAKALGFKVEKSALWPPVRHLQPVEQPVEPETEEPAVEEPEEHPVAVASVLEPFDHHLGGFA